MLSPVHALGPGERVCLWTQGCAKNCPGCISPEMQPHAGPQVDEALLSELLTQAAERGGCTGLTISGGDPFEQPEALLRLLELVRTQFEDILVYTGYTLAELQRGEAGDAAKTALTLIDVLIDGRYIQSENRPDCVLRGSANQVIHYLSPEAQPRYAAYLLEPRRMEVFSHQDTMIIAGIPDRRTES